MNCLNCGHAASEHTDAGWCLHQTDWGHGDRSMCECWSGPSKEDEMDRIRESITRITEEDNGSTILDRIRQSLQARLEGRNEGGDIEVMRLVDEIVKKEGLIDPKYWPKSMRSMDPQGPKD